MSIAAATAIGTVRLTVSDLARAREFYGGTLGLHEREHADGSLLFGGPEGEALIELHGDPTAPALDRRAPGLYHVALLLPTRADLAHAVRRIAQSGWPLDGASDHLVSEALYLSDPDGNGIEIYRDRPRGEWPQSDGQLQMATLPLDLQGVLSELPGAEPVQQTVPGGTRVGHIHLQVSDLRQAEAFYGDVLGFDVIVRSYPGALFVSAGGYHHHIGLNTWHSAGAGTAQSGAIGLRSFDIELPDESGLSEVLDRVERSGVTLEHAGGVVLVRDPFENAVRLRARAHQPVPARSAG